MKGSVALVLPRRNAVSPLGKEFHITMTAAWAATQTGGLRLVRMPGQSNELMRSQPLHAKLDLRRRRDGRQDDLQRGDRNAVAHHDEE